MMSTLPTLQLYPLTLPTSFTATSPLFVRPAPTAVETPTYTAPPVTVMMSVLTTATAAMTTMTCVVSGV